MYSVTWALAAEIPMTCQRTYHVNWRATSLIAVVSPNVHIEQRRSESWLPIHCRLATSGEVLIGFESKAKYSSTNRVLSSQQLTMRLSDMKASCRYNSQYRSKLLIQLQW